MTSNQISYRKLLEDRRHNRAQEEEVRRANLASEKIKRKDQKIQEKYNAAHFMHNTNVLMETARHNLSMESRDLLQLTRNLAETERHNRETELLSRDKLNRDYNIALRDVSLREANISELARHNLALEGMQSQVNAWNYELGKEKNVLSGQSIENQYAIDRLRTAETQRSNVQNALLEYQKVKEQKRHNVAMEQVSQKQNEIRGLESLSGQINQWYKTLAK